MTSLAAFLNDRLTEDLQRVLAEVEAKRRIVRMHAPGIELCYWSHDSNTVHDDNPCVTLLVLAAVYQDHPDFQPEWSSNA